MRAVDEPSPAAKGGGAVELAEKQKTIKFFEVNVRGKDWQESVSATTAGAAKASYLRDVQESWQGVRFTDITCRRIGSLPPTRAELAQREADVFNAAHPIGTRVRYWSGVKEGEPTGIGEIHHAATVVSEHACAWIKGAGSCHSISHVEAI